MLQGEVAVGERKTKRGGIKYRGMISTAAGIAKEEVSVGNCTLPKSIPSVWFTWDTLRVSVGHFKTL